MDQQSRIGELFRAAQGGDAVKLAELLEAHPGLANEANGDGLTPLGYAAHFGNSDAVRVLLDAGAVVNAVSSSKVSYIPSNTALHAAIAGERCLETIGLLLERGADTRLFDSNGHTCLHTAAFHDDNVQLIAMLLKYGADVNAAAEGGETALSIAVKRDNGNVAAFLRERGAKE
ncbi:ankyrin repeat domain-containing protein [Paenibacillus ginsengarvi]|uniref:Ankyrin repeat domain-containing protein n=1 Tax=Paenibacillus ginsengarvi TaxID=400777 RepID=A0A3B0CCN4_9BACL|nr:ankyrin repeat domain-containing protein [Paenibacillus ginsengarvi]RKN84075.1 ankyrin repeat domain-containing protein [Paenibacillus ginsengarvi]